MLSHRDMINPYMMSVFSRDLNAIIIVRFAIPVTLDIRASNRQVFNDDITASYFKPTIYNFRACVKAYDCFIGADVNVSPFWREIDGT